VERDDRVTLKNKDSNIALKLQQKAIEKIFETGNQVNGKSKLYDHEFTGTIDVNEKNKKKGDDSVVPVSRALIREVKNEIKMDKLFESGNQDNDGSRVNDFELTGNDVNEKNRNENKAKQFQLKLMIPNVLKIIFSGNFVSP